MHFIISGKSLQAWTQAIHSIARLRIDKIHVEFSGTTDQIHTEPTEDENDENNNESRVDCIILSALSPLKNWNIRYEFKVPLFENLEVDDGTRGDVLILRVKNLVDIFKNAGKFVKKGATCRFKYEHNADKVVITILYNDGLIRRGFRLNYETADEAEQFEIRCKNYVVFMNPYSLSEILSNFHNDTQEVLLRVNSASIRLRSHRFRSRARSGILKKPGETHFHLDLSIEQDIHPHLQDPATLITLPLPQLRPFVRLCAERKLKIYFYFEKGRPIKFMAIEDDKMTFSLILDSEVTDIDPSGEFADMQQDTEPSESERQQSSDRSNSRPGPTSTDGPKGYTEGTENNREEINNNQGSPEQLRQMGDSPSEQEGHYTPASLNRSRPPIQRQMESLFQESPNHRGSSSSISVPAPPVDSPNDSHGRAQHPLMTDDESEGEDIDPNFVRASQRSGVISSQMTVVTHCTVGQYESTYRNSSLESNDILADFTLESEDEDDDWL